MYMSLNKKGEGGREKGIEEEEGRGGSFRVLLFYL